MFASCCHGDYNRFLRLRSTVVLLKSIRSETLLEKIAPRDTRDAVGAVKRRTGRKSPAVTAMCVRDWFPAEGEPAGTNS